MLDQFYIILKSAPDKEARSIVYGLHFLQVQPSLKIAYEQLKQIQTDVCIEWISRLSYLYVISLLILVSISMGNPPIMSILTTTNLLFMWEKFENPLIYTIIPLNYTMPLLRKIVLVLFPDLFLTRHFTSMSDFVSWNVENTPWSRSA